jgi:hypothetical protein
MLSFPGIAAYPPANNSSVQQQRERQDAYPLKDREHESNRLVASDMYYRLI